MTFKQLKDFFEKNNLDPNTKILIDTRPHVSEPLISPEFVFVSKKGKKLVIDGLCAPHNSVMPPLEDYPESKGWETFHYLKKTQGSADGEAMAIRIIVRGKEALNGES